VRCGIAMFVVHTTTFYGYQHMLVTSDVTRHNVVHMTVFGQRTVMKNRGIVRLSKIYILKVAVNINPFPLSRLNPVSLCPSPKAPPLLSSFAPPQHRYPLPHTNRYHSHQGYLPQPNPPPHTSTPLHRTSKSYSPTPISQ
jgi:hypothetical protein